LACTVAGFGDQEAQQSHVLFCNSCCILTHNLGFVAITVKVPHLILRNDRNGYKTPLSQNLKRTFISLSQKNFTLYPESQE
jgi:hypothetical protein